MRLSIQGKEYVVRFEHEVFNKYTLASLFEVTFDENSKIVIPDDAIYVAEAFCHYKDNFSKKTGRIVAFTRLLEWMTKNRFMLTREERTEIWNKYFDIHSK